MGERVEEIRETKVNDFDVPRFRNENILDFEI